MSITKEQLRIEVESLFGEFLYYGRKEDEDFTLEDAMNLPSIISQEQLLEMFLEEVNKIYEGVDGG